MLQIVNICVLNSDEKKILLINRVKEPYKSYWGMPGGKIKEGELPMQAAIRELFEETGIKTENPSYEGVCHEQIFENGKLLYEFEIHFFRVMSNSDSKKIDREGELIWAPINQINSTAVIPSDYPMIKSFFKGNKIKYQSIIKKIGEQYFLDKFEAKE